MNIIVMGPQGSGKSTQAKTIAAKLGLFHLASGEVLRQLQLKDSDDGRQVKEMMNRGDLVPDELLFREMRTIIESRWPFKGLVMDGYPRSKEQIFLVEELLKEKEWQIDKVIVIDLPDEVGVGRIMKRVQIEGRSDDTSEAIKKRLGIYHKETQPIIDYFEEQGKVIHIDGQPDAETVTKDILSHFQM